MRGSRVDMVGGRTGRWRLIGAMAAVAVAGAGLGACTDDGTETVEASPSVLADTAADIRSGRMEVTWGPATSVMQFDGEDMRITTEFPDGAGATIDGTSDGEEDENVESWVESSTEMLTVDGVTYMESDGRWMTMPTFDLDAESGVAADSGVAAETVPTEETAGFGDFVSALSTILSRSTVDQPGERVERQGRALVRYRTEMTAKDADELIAEMVGGAQDADANSEDRYERVMAYLYERMTLEVVGEVDDRGELVRLEVHQRADLADYPDCEVYSEDDLGGVTGSTMVLTEINEPQDIQAPPAELIDEFEVPSPLDLGIVDGEVPPEIQAELDAAAIGGPQLDVEPDAAAESLQTATGPRTRSEILDYLRRWAEATGIDWRTIPLPDDAGMVALFDARYAEDLASRGPELTTPLGPYPRGYLVEVVQELDPALDAPSLDDAALVAAYVGLRGVGDVPSTSDWADDLTTETTVVSSDDPEAEYDSGSEYDSGFESEAEYLEGCPD